MNRLRASSALLLVVLAACDRSVDVAPPSSGADPVVIAPRIARAASLDKPVYDGAATVLVEALDPGGSVLAQASASFAAHAVTLPAVSGDARVRIRVTGRSSGGQALWSGSSPEAVASSMTSGVSTSEGGVASPLVEVFAAPAVRTGYAGTWWMPYTGDTWTGSDTYGAAEYDLVSYKQIHYETDGTVTFIYACWDSALNDQLVYVIAKRGTFLQNAPDSFQVTYDEQVSCGDRDAHFETDRVSRCANAFLDGEIDWSQAEASTSTETFRVTPSGSTLRIGDAAVYQAGVLPVPHLLGRWATSSMSGTLTASALYSGLDFSVNSQFFLRFLDDGSFEFGQVESDPLSGATLAVQATKGRYHARPEADSVVFVPASSLECEDADAHFETWRSSRCASRFVGGSFDWSQATASTDSVLRLSVVPAGSSLLLNSVVTFLPE